MTARYVFGPDASGGVVFGLAWRQLPALAIGVTAGILAMTGLPTDAGVLAAVVAVAVGGAVALVSVAGHRVDEWLPLWAAWARDRLIGAHRWRSPAPGRGHTPDGQLAAAAPPPALAGVDVCAAPLDGGAQLGVVADDRLGTCAAVLQLSGHGLLLASDGDRAGRLAGWGDVLAGLARADAPIARVQWLHRITPDDGTDPTTWATDHQPADAPDAAVDSYHHLLAGHAGGTLRHEELVVVAVSAAKAGITSRRDRRDRLAAVLAGENDQLASRLTAGGFTVAGVLTPTLLAHVVRRGLDPHSPSPVVVSGRVPPVWPLAVDATTSALRCDGAWHAAYWIEQWPAAAVPGEFLAPLIVDCRVPRTISITAEPIHPARARRAVERDLVAAAADDDLRARLGFRVTARRHAQTQTAQRREEQLAAGHGEYRVVGLITVSGETKRELEGACRQVEQLAAACHLGVRRLWGRQAEAHAATLPLAAPSPHATEARDAAAAARPAVVDGDVGGGVPVDGRPAHGRHRHLHRHRPRRLRLLLRPLDPVPARHPDQPEHARRRAGRVGQERPGQDAAVARPGRRPPRVGHRPQGRVPHPGRRERGDTAASRWRVDCPNQPLDPGPGGKADGEAVRRRQAGGARDEAGQNHSHRRRCVVHRRDGRVDPRFGRPGHCSGRPDYLASVAAQEGRVVLAVLLFLVAASSAFATAFLLFPMLRRHAEGMAAGYVGLRAFENVFYVAGVVGLLMMVTVSQSGAATSGSADLALLGTALLALHDWSVLMGTLIFIGLGSVTLNYVLYRSRLVPRWLSLWGLIGAPLAFVYGLLGILGFGTELGSPFMLLAMPIAVQEMVFAGWLIVRGFERRAGQLDQAPEARVDVMH